jgi:hypothetical protein
MKPPPHMSEEESPGVPEEEVESPGVDEEERCSGPPISPGARVVE